LQAAGFAELFDDAWQTNFAVAAATASFMLWPAMFRRFG
jgi:hypothetical protein